MATKGQKQKVYTNELKKEVMQKYYSGYAGTRILGKEYGIPQHTMDTWTSMVVDWIDFYDRQRIRNPRKKKNKKLN